MVSIWIFDFLLCDVLPDALEYLSGIFGSAGLKADRHSALDIQTALELGISRNAVPSGRRSVRFWILRCNADFDCAWPDYDVIVQTKKLVRLLPYGYDDAAYLQGEK